MLNLLSMQEHNGRYTNRRRHKGSQDFQNKMFTVPHCRGGEWIDYISLQQTQGQQYILAAEFPFFFFLPWLWVRLQNNNM